MELAFKVGTMIELPRAAMTADEIAEAAEFFSFGTNDLTQMTWGFSRDDVEAAFFSQYLEKGIFGVSPFESLDQTGVGGLVTEAVVAAAPRARTSTSGSAASTAATPTPSTSSRPPGWTTCPARRSGSRWPAWRQGARLPARLSDREPTKEPSQGADTGADTGGGRGAASS